MLQADNKAILKEYESFNACMPEYLAKIDIERFKAQSSCFKENCNSNPLGSQAGKIFQAFAALTLLVSFAVIAMNLNANTRRQTFKEYEQPTENIEMTKAQNRAMRGERKLD